MFVEITYSQNKKSNDTGALIEYNSCTTPQEKEPLPNWYIDALYLQKEGKNYAKLLDITNFDVDQALAVSSTVSESDIKKIKKCAQLQDASDLALQNACKRLFITYINDFEAISTAGGSIPINKANLEQSFYQFITLPGTEGVTPLTILKQRIIKDNCPDDPGYTCYLLAYLRLDEFNKRMENLKEKEKEKEKKKENTLNDYYFHLDSLSKNCVINGDFIGALEYQYKAWLLSKKSSTTDYYSNEIKQYSKIRSILENIHIKSNNEKLHFTYRYNNKEARINHLGIFLKMKNENNWSGIKWVKDGFIEEEKIENIDSVRIEFKYYDYDYDTDYKIDNQELEKKGITLGFREEYRSSSEIEKYTQPQTIYLSSNHDSLNENNQILIAQINSELKNNGFVISSDSANSDWQAKIKVTKMPIVNTGGTFYYVTVNGYIVLKNKVKSDIIIFSLEGKNPFKEKAIDEAFKDYANDGINITKIANEIRDNINQN
jgi:hypothetical protein